LHACPPPALVVVTMPGAWGTDNRRSRAYVAGNGRSGADIGRSAGTPSFAASGPPGVAPSHKDAFAEVLASVLAKPVTVQLTDGATYSGTLTGVAPGDKELSLVLHFARLLQPAEAVAALGVPPVGGAPKSGGDTPVRRPSSATVTTDLLIPGHKLAMVAVDAAAVEDGEAARAVADGTAAGVAADGGGGRFTTDTGISGRKGGAGGGAGDRQLTRFDDFGPTAPVGVGGDLADGGLGSGGGAGGGAGGGGGGGGGGLAAASGISLLRTSASLGCARRMTSTTTRPSSTSGDLIITSAS